MNSTAGAKPVLRALTGCTGVGKTEWALRWAESVGAEIVSCDSLLFYRGMNIGTAKPTGEELARVPHHLVDCCDVTERMDVTRFVTLARAALQDIIKRGKSALVVGGSGFYLKSLFAPVADEVQVAAELRAEIAALSIEEAVARLRAVNPNGLGSLDTANPRRVTRALERCLASGQTVAELAQQFAQQPSSFADWQIALTEIERAPAELEARIIQRVEHMLGAGLVEEVRDLLAQGLKGNPSASLAIGYREVVAMIEGQLAAENLASEIVRNTKRLVKKQRTWFRTQLPQHRIFDAAKLRSPAELF